MPKNKKNKIYENEWKEDIEFPKLLNYEELLYTPEKLEDINKDEADISIKGGTRALTALDADGNLIKEVVNTKLDTQTKQILGDFTFGTAGAIKMLGTGSAGVWISPTGILGKNTAGTTTFAITANDGSATFRGTVYAEAGVVAGSIVSSGINADNITAGTLTGRTIQTAYTGLRVRISSSPQNKIEFLRDNTVYGWLEVGETGDVGYLSLGGSGGSLEIGTVLGVAATQYVSMPFLTISGRAAFGTVMMEGSPNYPRNVGLEWSGGGEAFWSFNLGDALARINSHIYPSTSGYNLGSSTYRWQHLYLSGNISIGGNITPSTGNISDLGSSTYRWRRLYLGGGFLYLARASGATAATWPVEDGAMYYRTDDDVIRVRIAGVWKTVSVT